MQPIWSLAHQLDLETVRDVLAQEMLRRGLTGDAGWFEATMWLLGAGLILAGLAAVAGLTDVLGDARIRGLGTAWWHAGGNVLAVVIEIVNIFLRNAKGSAAVLPTGIILSAIVVCILLFTGWKGWELVYRHRVGVSEAP